MVSKHMALSVCFVAALGSASIALAQPDAPAFVRVQSHAGQMDTDGILSPGEVPNPRINYDRAQRNGERNGDYRYDNPDNDAAARAEHRDRYDDRYYSDRYRDDRYSYNRDYDRDYDHDYDRDYDRHHHSRDDDSWWNR